MSLNISRRALLAAGVASWVTPAFAKPGEVYRDAAAPVDARVRDLLSRMTVEEKVAQMRALWVGKAAMYDRNGDFAADKAGAALKDGIGQVARPSDLTGTIRVLKEKFRTPADAARYVNDVQRYLVEKTRLGIPALFHEETAHGLMAGDATVFPIPPALASTWDPDLIEQVFTVTARQARGRGVTIGLSPVLDLLRDPRFGRSEEFFSEDPYLTAQMGVAAVRGLQGRTRPIGKDRVFATLKHFVHGSPQGGLNTAPADSNDRTLRETYLVPFAQVIRSAAPAIVMPSYNEVEGVPAHASVDLLQKTGRDRLGFTGAYMSDYGGVQNLMTQHHVAATKEEAAILAIEAGVDAELPDGTVFLTLPALVASGRVSLAKIDAAVARILQLKFEAGLFEYPFVDAKRLAKAVSLPSDEMLARTVAEKAVILLKNDGTLPLDPNARLKVAVIGPNAAAPMLGGYSGENARCVSVMAGLRAVRSNAVFEQSDGVWITQPPRSDGIPTPMRRVPEAENATRIAAAVEVAMRSDVIVLVVGDTIEVTREAVMFSQPGDRNALSLFGDQDKLVEAMLATGKPVVAILLNGRPLAVTRLADRSNALIEGWYLGQEGGTAIANTLFGLSNPGGKMTVSVPRSVGELPAYYNRHPSADTNQYVEGKRTPLFPFGHGLSYTSFRLSPPRLSQPGIAVGDSFTVEVDVTNTGKRVGDEVVQLYVRDDVSSVPRPTIELKAFRRVRLKPGETRTVRFDLSSEALAFWTIAMKWAVEPGTFTISTGNSSASLQAATLTVSA